MNLDDLRSVQSKERQKDSLQHLRDSFYEDVGDYIGNLKNERDRAAERADDPFASSEVSQLTDEIKAAEEVVEAVYERRMGKIVKRASLAAAGMTSDEEGLTAEESELFTDLVDRIERNKNHVLDVLSGEASPASTPAETDTASPVSDATERATPESDTTETASPETDPTPPPAPPDRPPEAAEADAESTNNPSVDAADLMGGDGAETAPGNEGTDDPTESTVDASETPTPRADPPGDDAGATPEMPPEEGASPPDSEGTDRTTVRITEEIGDIFGVDDREYELSAEDVVTLPTANAEPLVEQDAAQRID